MAPHLSSQPSDPEKQQTSLSFGIPIKIEQTGVLQKFPKKLRDPVLGTLAIINFINQSV